MMRALVTVALVGSCFSQQQPAAASDATCIVESRDGWGPAGASHVSGQVVTSGLEVPWSFAFLPGGEVLVSERPGRVRLLQHGKLVAPPVLTVKTAETSEGGLLGIAVNPRDESQLFLYLTAPGPENQLQRWTLAKDHHSALSRRRADALWTRRRALRRHRRCSPSFALARSEQPERETPARRCGRQG